MGTKSFIRLLSQPFSKEWGNILIAICILLGMSILFRGMTGGTVPGSRLSFVGHLVPLLVTPVAGLLVGQNLLRGRQRFLSLFVLSLTVIVWIGMVVVCYRLMADGRSPSLGSNHSLQRTGASRFAKPQLKSQWRLAAAADFDRYE